MKLTSNGHEACFVTMPDFTSHNLLLFTELLHLIRHSFLKDFTDGIVVS